MIINIFILHKSGRGKGYGIVVNEDGNILRRHSKTWKVLPGRREKRRS